MLGGVRRQHTEQEDYDKRREMAGDLKPLQDYIILTDYVEFRWYVDID